MKHSKILFFLFSLALSSCSSMSIYSSLDSQRYNSANANFNMTISSGDKLLDDYIANIAYFEFSKHVPINEKRDHTGILEILFQSNDEKVHSITKDTYSDKDSYTEIDPDHYGTVSVDSEETAVKSEETTLKVFNFQNSTMFVVMKDLEGNRIWAANYNYKGATELTGVLVNTPQEAAKLCIEKISKNMGKKFTRSGQ